MATPEAKAILRAKDMMSPAIIAAARNLGLKLSPALQKAKTQTKGFTKATKEMVGRIKSITGAAGKVAGLAGGLLGGVSVASFAAMTKSYVDATDRMAKFGKTVNLTAEQLQGLEYAAGINGISTQVLNKSLERFNLNVAQAKDGTGSFRRFLDRVSPSLRKTIVHSKGTNEAFRAMVDALSKVEDPAKRALLAAEAFGRKNGSYIALLGRDGLKGLDALIEKQKRYGLTTNENAEDAEAMADALLDLDMATAGAKKSIMGALLPSLKPLVTASSEWLAQNKELIKSKMVGFLEGTGKALKQLERSGALAWMKKFARYAGSNLATAGKAVLRVLRRFAPILKGPLGSAFRIMIGLGKAMAEIFKQVLGPSIEWLLNKLADLMEWIKDTDFGRYLKKWSEKLEYVLENFDSLFATFRENLSQNMGRLVDGISQKWDDFKSLIGETWQEMKRQTTNALDSVWQKIKPFWDKVKPIIDGIGSLWNGEDSTRRLGSIHAPLSPTNAPTAPWNIPRIQPTAQPGMMNGSLNGVVEVKVSAEPGAKANVIQARNKTNTQVRLKADTGQRSLWGM